MFPVVPLVAINWAINAFRKSNGNLLGKIIGSCFENSLQKNLQSFLWIPSAILLNYSGAFFVKSTVMLSEFPAVVVSFGIPEIYLELAAILFFMDFISKYFENLQANINVFFFDLFWKKFRQFFLQLHRMCFYWGFLTFFFEQSFENWFGKVFEDFF